METIPTKLKTEVFEKLFNLTEYTALSPEEKEAYEESLKRHNDLKNSIDTAVLEKTIELSQLLEKAKIREEEAKNKLKETALFLKKSGMSLEEISNLTGLSLNELEKM